MKRGRNRSPFGVSVWIVALALVPARWLCAAPPAKPPPTTGPSPIKYANAKAYYILPETTSEESGYFSLCEGLDGNVYVGTAKYNRNAYLVEFEPRTEKQRIVIDTNQTCGLTAAGYAAQSKIHTRNFVGPSGKVYVGSKQGYRAKDDTSDYPGGYVMTYDPRTGRAENLGMPFKDEGVIDVVADEERGLLYVVTCEQQHWMISESLKGITYRELGPLLTPYATTLVAADGRAYALTTDFKLASYDPATKKVTTRPIEVDGKPFTRTDNSGIPTWQLSPDRRRAYLILMNDPTLVEIDLAGAGDAPAVRAVSHGKMVQGKHPDSRGAMSVAPDGRVYALVRVDNETKFGTGYLHHLARFDPATKAIEDLGVLKVSNPDYFNFGPGPDGKKPPHSHGFHTLPDGALTPMHAHMALMVTRDNTVYATIIYPFTLLRVDSTRTEKPRTSAADQFVDYAIGVCDRAEERSLAEITKIAETMADRHITGGMVGFPVWEHTLTYELWGRAGGVIHVGFDRPWKPDKRTDAEAAKDVAIVSYDGLTKKTPGDKDLAEIQKVKSRGGYVIGLGPRADARLPEIVAACDVWIDTGDHFSLSPVPRGEGRGEGPLPPPLPPAAHTVANTVHGWVLMSEYFAALSRRGKVTPMWLSFEHPDGKAWADRYLGKGQFHTDVTIPAIPPGDLGRRVLQQFRHSLRRLQGPERDHLNEAAKLIATEASAGRKVIVGWSGHMPENYVGRLGDPWAQRFQLPVILSQWRQGMEPYQKDAPANALLVRLNTAGLDPAERAIHRERKQRLIVITGTHDDPAWNARGAEDLVRIDTAVPFADACVPVDGYPIRIIPASGLAQLVAYQAVAAEVSQRIGNPGQK